MTEETMAEAVAEEATAWLGTPYRHQGSLRGVGADCLGLVRGIWRAIHKAEPEIPPRYTPDWAETGHEDRLADAAARHLVPVGRAPKTGDCILFRWRPDSMAKHLGIMVSDDHFIHAYSGVGTVRSPLVPQWRRKISGVYRFPLPDELKDRR